VRLVGLRPTAGTGVVVPVPMSGREWGLPDALSVNTSVAVRLPAAVGVKVTLAVQLPPAGNVDGLRAHVVFSAKSVELVPPMATEVIVSGALPLLVSVAVCPPLDVPICWLVKVRVGGLRVTAGADAPVPERATVWGLPDALADTDRDPVRAPVAVGLKVRLIVHEPPAPSVVGLAGQPFVWAKSAALAPAREIELMARGAPPLLVRVTAWDALVVFTGWLAKVRLVGPNVTAAGVVAVVRNLLMMLAVIWRLLVLE